MISIGNDGALLPPFEDDPVPKPGRWQSAVVCPWCGDKPREWPYTCDVEGPCAKCGRKFTTRTKRVYATQKGEANP